MKTTFKPIKKVIEKLNIIKLSYLTSTVWTLLLDIYPVPEAGFMEFVFTFQN